jgi:hypothetical protein
MVIRIASDPTLRQIRRIAGEGGQVSYDVDVPTIGGTRHFAFAGNIFVGPVLVTSRDEAGQWDQEVIDDPRRFGEFVSSDWVSRFLAARHGDGPSDQTEAWRRIS